MGYQSRMRRARLIARRQYEANVLKRAIPLHKDGGKPRKQMLMNWFICPR
jgi:hypothetical protein